MKTAIMTIVAAASCAAGCEALDEAGVPGMSAFIDRSAQRDEEAEYREKFAADGDPEAFRWLLANRVEQGMSVNDIDRILGQGGVREETSGWLKNKGGNYRQDDTAYKWGPDADGNSVYLLFRSGALVNFDPREFESL